MSNHPMCKECVAVSVCGVKYGQPSCVKVHGLVISFGKTVANSGILEAEKTASPNTAMLQLLSETRDYIDAVRQSALGSEIVLRKLNAVLAQQQHN